MTDRPESENGELERLRTEVAALRGKLRGLECDRAPAGDRCGCPDCSHVPEPPLLNPLTATLLLLTILQLAAAMTMCVAAALK